MKIYSIWVYMILLLFLQNTLAMDTDYYSTSISDVQDEETNKKKRERNETEDTAYTDNEKKPKSEKGTQALTTSIFAQIQQNNFSYKKAID